MGRRAGHAEAAAQPVRAILLSCGDCHWLAQGHRQRCRRPRPLPKPSLAPPRSWSWTPAWGPAPTSACTALSPQSQPGVRSSCKALRLGRGAETAHRAASQLQAQVAEVRRVHAFATHALNGHRCARDVEGSSSCLAKPSRPVCPLHCEQRLRDAGSNRHCRRAESAALAASRSLRRIQWGWGWGCPSTWRASHSSVVGPGRVGALRLPRSSPGFGFLARMAQCAEDPPLVSRDLGGAQQALGREQHPGSIDKGRAGR